MSFCLHTAIKPKHSVPEQVFVPAVSHIKTANIHVRTIHQNVRIALQFSYQFAIFISVCNSHILVNSSYVVLCNFHMSLQFFSYEFAIFISVCNSHVTTPAISYVALHGFYVTMTLNSLTPHQPQFSMEDKDKLELSKIDYYLLFKYS